ncbi:MAG TPA: hypothetical protein HPP90_01720 [Deltaproteobacteria bacterium]|nr:hypothetical protein [Deltaproteobacteria bacterium]
MTIKNYLTTTFKCRLAAIFFIALFILSSCGPPLATRASRVRIVNVEQIREVENQCEFLANVRGSNMFAYCCIFSWGFLNDTFYGGAFNELLDNAAELGATHVFVNQGDGPYLIGEAFFCAFCIGPDGKPDENYCVGQDGRRDIGHCEDEFGARVGEAKCEGAEGKNRPECKANGGKWIPSLDEATCKKQNRTWMPEASDPKTCEEIHGVWLPRATDKDSCEAKGGTWVPNQDVLRKLGEDEKK